MLKVRLFFRFLRWVLLLLFFLVGIDTATNVLEHLGRLASSSFSFSDYLAFIVLGIPESVVEMFPPASLLAGLLTSALPSNRMELLFLQSVGGRPHQLLAPVVGAALLVGGMEWAAQEWLCPSSLAARARPAHPSEWGSDSPSRAAWFLLAGRYIRMESDRQGRPRALRMISRDVRGTITEISGNRIVKKGEGWVMKRARRRTFAADGAVGDDVIESLALPPGFTPEAASDDPPESLDGGTLRRIAKARRIGGLPHARHDMALAIRLSWPLACVLLAVGGTLGGAYPAGRGASVRVLLRGTALQVGGVIGVGGGLLLVGEGILSPEEGAWIGMLFGGVVFGGYGLWSRKGRPKRPLPRGGH